MDSYSTFPCALSACGNPFLFTTPNMIAPRMKRARTAASAAAAAPKLTLRGGEPHHSELASL